MNILIFAIGLTIFVTYMFFLVRMINIAHKKQEQELGPVRKTRVRKIKKSNTEVKYTKKSKE